MKNTLLVLLSLIMIVFSTSAFGQMTSELVERNGLGYLPYTTTPFTGTYNKFDENGQLETKTFYKKGKLHGPIIGYHDNGQLKAIGTFKDGYKDGPWEIYYRNGQLQNSSYLKDGKDDGINKSYFENGQLETSIAFKDGKVDGVVETYKKDGTLLAKALYSNNAMVSCEEGDCSIF